MKILLCEDDENLGMLLREYLNAKGFDTTLCADGEAGYQAFIDNKFDLCVFDVMMPRKDGFTLLMCDNFSATRSHILQAFAETWPKQLEPKWEFRALHSPHEEELL